MSKISNGQKLKNLLDSAKRVKKNLLHNATEATQVIDEFEYALEDSQEQCDAKDEKISSLEYDYSELEKKVDSHWCLCPHCGKEHANSK